MAQIEVKNLPEENEVSRKDMKRIMGGANDFNPLAEWESLGGSVDDKGPEGGGSIRA